MGYEVCMVKKIIIITIVNLLIQTITSVQDRLRPDMAVKSCDFDYFGYYYSSSSLSFEIFTLIRLLGRI